MSNGGRAFGDEPREVEAASSAPESADADLRLRAARARRMVQRKASSPPTSQAAKIPEAGGEALAPEVQSRMQGELGADLTGVKVHTGSASAGAAERLGARAFTDGSSIHFGSGEFAPGTRDGDRLLAHELTHVVQSQKSGTLHRKADHSNDNDAVSQPGDASELEADAVGDQIADRLHGGGGARPEIRQSGGGLSRKAKADAKDDEKKDEKKDAKPAVKKGQQGILNAEAHVKLGDEEATLKAGTVVEVKAVEGDQLKVSVLSGHEGKVAEISGALFQPEPGVDNDEETGKPRDDEYQDYGGAPLWGPAGPTVADVAQGYIGDCFLMAGMGAVVAQNPGAIKALFEPQTPGAKSYNVTLHKKGKDKKLKPVTVTVDTQLPTQKGSDHDPAYANNGKGEGAALWPALLEKAYAQLMGGYAEVGEGGMPGDAMQALTGVESGNEDMPDAKSTIEQFKGFEKEGKAVVAGTIGELQADKKRPFAGADDKFHAKLQTNEGLEAEVVQETLEIQDNESKHASHAKDDGKGKIKGAALASGTVDYGDGAVELEFKHGKAPEKAKNLEASYQYRGMISKDLKLYADHSYIFEKVDGDKLVFKNPWGSSHPNPVPAAEFVRLFDLLDTNQAKPDDGK